MTYKTIVVVIFGLFVITNTYGQYEELEKAYQKRIRQTHINGVYIPKDLIDCHRQLDKLIDEEGKKKFMAASEEQVLDRLHFSLGRWIWHNWGLLEGSRLSVYLNQMRVNNPEDMAQFIIITYHRKLNDKELDMKNLVPYLKERRLEKDKQWSEGKQ